MKKAVKEALAEKGLPNFGNRRPHKNATHNLCDCGGTRKEHFNNKCGHPFRAGGVKNNLSLSGEELKRQQKGKNA
jgi:hypothetical protein